MHKLFSLTVALSILVSAPAIALTEGQTATYTGVSTTVSGTSTSFNAILRLEKYDPAQALCKIASRLEFPNSAAVESLQDCNFALLQIDPVAICANLGGTIESITVPAGNFETCKTPVNDFEHVGTGWFSSKTPFLSVKTVLTSKKDGTLTVSDLVSFTP